MPNIDQSYFTKISALTVSIAILFLPLNAISAVQGADELKRTLHPALQQKPVITRALANPEIIDQIIILAMGASNTSKITRVIDKGRADCSSVPSEYQADCLAQTFKSASKTGLRMVDYVKPGQELRTAHKRIASVVSKNVDKSKPTIRKGGKTFRAVKKSAVASVNKQTKAIITETQTKLIRSAGNSAKRKTHFGAIAKAVGSTKTILRSA